MSYPMHAQHKPQQHIIATDLYRALENAKTNLHFPYSLRVES